MAKLATKNSVESGESINIHTPLINLTKAEIIKKGIDLGVDYSNTHSCYCLLYTSPSPRDKRQSRMPSSA